MPGRLPVPESKNGYGAWGIPKGAYQAGEEIQNSSTGGPIRFLIGDSTFDPIVFKAIQQ
jgi:hypothetical protein